MVKVTFVSSNGTRREVEAAEGETAREAALFNKVPGIDGDCGGAVCADGSHVHGDSPETHERFIKGFELPEAKDIADAIAGQDTSLIATTPRARIHAWLARISQISRFWKLARLTGLAVPLWLLKKWAA